MGWWEVILFCLIVWWLGSGSAQDLMAILDEDTYRKYEKFCLFRSNDNYR